MQRALKIGLVALLGSSLSGCIAAAAVPILAGTGVVGSRVVGGDGEKRVAEATIPRPPFDRPTAAPAVVIPAPVPEAVSEPVEIAPEPAAQAALTSNAGLIDPNAIEEIEPAALAVEAPMAVSALANEAANVPAAVPPPPPVEIAAVAPPPIAAPVRPAPAPAPVPAITTPPGTMPPVQLTLPDGRQIAVSGGGARVGELTPAQAQSLAQAPAETSAIGASAYSRLYEFAMEKSEPLGRGERRDSALLVAPGALRPDTSRCGTTQPAILIDLDPGDELLDPTARFADNPPLAQALASLRERNVSVHWISGNSAAFAGALRSRLEESGLDPDGKDELVLMRYPDDRKQVRRRSVGATHCLVAIAGEERGDFDELYEYLRSPDAAIALEALVGQGWFLIPPALVSKDEN